MPGLREKKCLILDDTILSRGGPRAIFGVKDQDFQSRLSSR